MHMRCVTGRHATAPDEVRNQGFGFSRCLRCGHDMVRSKRAWRAVPRGFRVVWRRGTPRQAELSAAQLLFDLPSAGRALTVVSLHKRINLAELLTLASVGLRALAGAAGERLRSWCRRLASLRPAGQPIVRLAPYARPEFRMPTP